MIAGLSQTPRIEILRCKDAILRPEKSAKRLELLSLLQLFFALYCQPASLGFRSGRK